MPQQPDSATPTRICRIKQSMLGKKLRIAGRIAQLDLLSGLAVVIDKPAGCPVLVDVSLCLEDEPYWARERLSQIIALGHLERSKRPLPVPSISPGAFATTIDEHLVLRAVLVIEATGLDLNLWNKTIEEEEGC